MRALVFALVVIAAPALAQESRTIEREGWTQFLPEWRMGPAMFAFGERNVSVPEWTSYATDGATWLYGSNETPERLQTPREGCAPADNITAVVITTDACSFAKHPSVVCAGTHICESIYDEPTAVASPTVRSAGPGPYPTSIAVFHPTPPQPPTPDQIPLDPDCRMLTSARCTPGPGALVALTAIGAAALVARTRR